MAPWEQMPLDDKVDLLKRSQAVWGNMIVPRLGEIRELIDSQAREIAHLRRRLDVLERGERSIAP